MRVRIEEIVTENGREVKHPDADRYLTAYDFKQIFIDGAEIKFVIAFDDVEGWVEFYPSDPNGRIIVPEDPERDHLDTARREGKITYTLVEEKDERSQAAIRSGPSLDYEREGA